MIKLNYKLINLKPITMKHQINITQISGFRNVNTIASQIGLKKFCIESYLDYNYELRSEIVVYGKENKIEYQGKYLKEAIEIYNNL